MINETPKPPVWADKFLNWFVAEDLIEEIQGDLHEAHFHRSQEMGRLQADRLFIADVFRFFKPYAFEKYSRAKQFLPMFNNYFKIAFRNILHRKSFTAINLVGLTFGIAAVMLIGFYLQNELTYDQSAPEHERIYRLHNHYRDQVYTCMRFPKYFNTEAKDQVNLLNWLKGNEEVETACHFVPSNSQIGGGDKYYVETDGEQFLAEKVLYTNTGMDFQAVFPQQFLAGSPESAFTGYDKVTITEKLAKQWFGSDWQTRDILGRNLTIRDENYELAAVIANVPGNVHYEFDWIVHQERIPSWAGYTYFKLKPNASVEPLLARLNQDINQIYPGYSEDVLSKGILSIPLADIHFTSDTLYELKPIANKAYLTTFGIVGLIILLIILTNYTNLSIAMYADRQKELGMRKVMGARSMDISLQLLIEAVLLAMICLPLVGLILYDVIPHFNELMQINIDRNLLFSGTSILVLIGVLALTGILSGIYPALAYGGRSMLGLFGKSKKINFNHRYFNFRNALLTAQFIMVIGLLSLTFFIQQQIDFISNKDLGYQKEGIVYFEIDGAEKYEKLENALLQLPEIEAVGANGVPGSAMYNQMTYKLKDTDVTLSDGTQQYLTLGTVKALGIKCEACKLLEEGKEKIFVINQTAAEKLAKIKGVEPQDLINETFVSEPEWENEEYGYGVHQNIDGIIDDYKFFSLKYPNQSLIVEIVAKPSWVYEMIVRADTDNWQATMQKIENEYEKIETVRPFDYAFLEDRINDLYLEERRSGTLMKGLSLVALILAMMGLAGIVSYIAYSRQKEIGIRKVLGASVGDILVNFNKQFSYMTLLATVIALPASIFLASKWLEGFAFQIEPQFWVVILAGLAALILVVSVVTIQARWAARQHPIDVLKVD